MAVRKKLIRDLVEKLLDDHGIRRGTAVPVERIARALGIQVKLDAVDDDLSGFLYRDRKTGRTVIGANKAHHKNRVRFTIAHELGHYFLHQGKVAHVDQVSAGVTIDFRNAKSAEGDDSDEKEANYFAAELLMPDKFLRQDLEGKRLDLLDDGKFLADLSEKYRVSQQALTFRLTNLGYIKL